ncbi:protein-L-isoaspartate(D-aspartate) O-methyltransferase [Hahella sp. SMD15-11]|uniref:Protein-L-isoaspartate O-methyltransferase n=1 Tax=Thermohahella caldifontis TaxID=3142973 RepID=A0AB39V1I5_9GAMM
MTSARTRNRLADKLREEGIRNEAVLNVIRTLPRHIFVDEALAHRAYENTALPIGYGQTISQPYIVARMTELALERRGEGRVLEVGTGSGYQCAVLASLFEQVFSVERIRGLQERARERFRALRLHNIRLKLDDGHWGWAENGPYDVIVVTAAPEQVPDELLAQLKPQGRLIIPVGGRSQRLEVYDRDGDEFQCTPVEPVRFVPLVGGVIRS